MGWFKRNQNRKMKREATLEVRTSSRRIRQARLRWAASGIIGLGLLAGLVGGLWRGGEWLLNRLVFENEVFAIRVIDVQTDGVIPTEQLRKWGRVKLGDNLYALDLVRVQRDLQLVPLIREAAVERVTPHTLKVRVTEREPFAQVNAFRPKPADGGYEIVVYYLDEDGYVLSPMGGVMERAPAVHPNESLPVLIGVNNAELRVGKPVESAQIFAALRLIAEYERSPMFGVEELARIDLSSPGMLSVTTGQGSQVFFGLAGVDRQLRRWRAAYDAGAANGKRIATLDLSVTNNVPVRWLVADQNQPVTSKPVKIPRYRKKHV